MKVPLVPASLDRAAGWSWRLLVCGAAILAALALLWYVRVIVLPAILALTIAPALTPLANLFRRGGFGRAAPATALVVGIAAVAGLAGIVTASVVEEYDELRVAVTQGVEDVTSWVEEEPFNLSLDRGGDRDLGTSITTAWRESSTYLVSGVRSSLSVLTGLVLAIALLYFILRDGRAVWGRVVRLFPPESRRAVDRAGNRAWSVLGGFVRGTALIAAIDATLIGLGLWILGVPLAFALAVLIFLGSFVPFVGATLSGLVAVLVALADAGWETALAALAIVIGVQFLEGNFLQPIIQSRTVDLHPAVILLAVAAGASLFGILGAYLAVPVTAVVFAASAALAADEAAVGAAALDPKIELDTPTGG